MIDAQCDDGRTPCDPPRPQYGIVQWDEHACDGDDVVSLTYTSLMERRRLRCAVNHRGATCTASEAT